MKYRGETIPQGQGKSSEVGYKKPPREHQFKKGQSGNPGGGRKGRTLLGAIREQAAANNDAGLAAAAKAYLSQMNRGSFQHAKEYIEREEGAVPQDGKLTIEVVYRHPSHASSEN